MLRVDPSDPAAVNVDVEVWSVPYEGLTAVLLGEPQGLSIGKVRLEDPTNQETHIFRLKSILNEFCEQIYRIISKLRYLCQTASQVWR